MNSLSFPPSSVLFSPSHVLFLSTPKCPEPSPTALAFKASGLTSYPWPPPPALTAVSHSGLPARLNSDSSPHAGPLKGTLFSQTCAGLNLLILKSHFTLDHQRQSLPVYPSAPPAPVVHPFLYLLFNNIYCLCSCSLSGLLTRTQAPQKSDSASDTRVPAHRSVSLSDLLEEWTLSPSA